MDQQNFIKNNYSEEQKNALKDSGNLYIEEILITLGVDFAMNGRYIQGCCPAKNHGGDGDNRSAFCWDLANNIWACFSWNCMVDVGNDLYGLIRAVLDCTFAESVEWLDSFLRNDIKVKPEDIKCKTSKSLNFKNKTSSEEKLKFLDSTQDGLKFLIDRGFSYEILQDFDVGFWKKLGSNMHERIIIPVRDYHGKIVGFTGRTIWPKDEWPTRGVTQKWKHGPDYDVYYSAGFRKSLVVFNLNNAKDHLKNQSIVLTEGPLDGIKLSMVGIHNWISCLGSSFTATQKSLLAKSGINKIYIALDGDKAGNIATERIKKSLEDLFEITLINLPEGKDPGDLSVDEIKEIFHEAM